MASRLAADLAFNDVPVWIDTWMLDVGESLEGRIREGIDESTWFIALVSQRSVESGWVARELQWALAKQQELGRLLVLPIRIDSTEMPTEIRDVVYVDLSGGYLDGFERLLARIHTLGWSDADVGFDRLIIPIYFTKGIYLTKARLSQRIEAIKSRVQVRSQRGPSTVRAEQILPPFDQQYLDLRRKLQRRIENVESDEFFSPELVETLASVYDTTQRAEWAMRSRLAELVGLAISPTPPRFDPVEACYWVAKLFRSSILGSLHFVQSSTDPEPIEYDGPRTPTSPDTAQKFFEDSIRMERFQFLREDFSYFGAWLPADLEAVQWFLHLRGQWPPEPVNGWLGGQTLAKYVVPLMLYSNFMRPDDPVTWDFDAYSFGRP